MAKKVKTENETEVAPAEAVADDGTVTIAGRSFRIPSRYSAGHTLTEGEASQLNQVFRENVGNNFRKQIKDAGEGLNVDEMQGKIDTYTANYQFGVRTPGASGPRLTDPLAREALRLAKLAVENAIRKRGENPKDYDAKALSAKALEVSKTDRYQTLARNSLDALGENEIELPSQAAA